MVRISVAQLTFSAKVNPTHTFTPIHSPFTVSAGIGEFNASFAEDWPPSILDLLVSV